LLFKAVSKNTKTGAIHELEKRLKNGGVKVGIIKAKGKVVYEGTDASVAYIGSIHEFGHEESNIPERSFIRSTIQDQQENLKKLLAIQAIRIIEDGISVTKALNTLGAFTAGKIKKKFTNNDWKELEDSTKKSKVVNGKSGNTPLINTGQLRNSIHWEVVSD